MGAHRGGVDPSVHGVAGAVAGQVSTLVLYPLDQARFFMQVSRGQGPPGASWRCGSTLTVLQDIARQQGLRGVYQGICPMLVTVGISQGIYFWVYEALQSWSALTVLVSSLMRVLPLTLNNLVVALLASITTVFLTNPLWVAAMHLKFPPPLAKQGKRRGSPLLSVFAMAAEIAEADGAAALWKGLGPSLWLCAAPTLNFVAYEAMKSVVLEWDDHAKHPSGVEAFFMGAIAKGVSTIATYPLQVAQTNLRILKKQGRSGTARSVLKELMAARGLPGLFAGFEAKIMQTLLNGALMMLIYEQIVQFVAAIWPS